MKVGDTVTATWSDGLQIAGIYARTERGYIILLDLIENREVACNPECVVFESGNKVPQVRAQFQAGVKHIVCAAIAGFVIGVWVGS